jgi:large subunit ribosomal protein L19
VNKLVEIEKEMQREDMPKFGPGDTVKVSFRVHEGKKDRVQSFQGICIKIRGAGPSRSFTLRKISQGIGVERIFPANSPLIEKVEIVRYGKVRRAKLYYLRDKVGKARFVKERIVAKTEGAKKPRRKKKKVKAEQASSEKTKAEKVKSETQEATEEASSVEADAKSVKTEDGVKNEKPAEAPSKEAADAADQSGSGGVEKG